MQNIFREIENRFHWPGWHVSLYPLEFLGKTFQFTLLHVKPLIFLTNVAINSVIFMHASENSGKGSKLNAVFPSQAGQAGVMTIFSPGV